MVGFGRIELVNLTQISITLPFVIEYNFLPKIVLFYVKMDYREAFDHTLEKFGITAKSLALKSGVQERQISHFRNKQKDLMAGNLFSLVAVLPTDAQIYFFSCVASESMLETVDLRSLVKSMPAARKSEVLTLIADSLLESRENTDTTGLISAV